MARPNRFILAVVATICTTAALVTIVQASQPGGVFGDSELYPGLNRAPTSSIPSELKAKIGVFRTAATRSDTPPTASEFGPTSDKSVQAEPLPFGANPALARRVSDGPGGGGVFLIPGSAGVCFASASRVQEGCQPIANVLSGNNAQAVICSPYLGRDERAVYGIVPDGAQDARVTYADGSSRALAIDNNTYSIRARAPEPLPVSVTWTDGTGEQVTMGSSMPADADESRCAQPSDLENLPKFER